MPDVVTPYYTVATGPGRSAEQPDASSSLGGFAAANEWLGGRLGDLFGRASSADIEIGRSDHRAIYVANSGVAAVAGLRVYVVPVSAGGGGVSVGADPRPPTSTDSASAQAVEPFSAYAVPPGVEFNSPADYSEGVDLGDLEPGTGRALWVRRTPLGSGDAAAESADVLFDDGVHPPVIRRLIWDTEPASTPTAPFRVQSFTPSPTPFRRLNVDFLSLGGARITWDIDPALTDEGPYYYQLQTAHSGVEDADDWVDVGPPAFDASYLLDPAQRVWGMTPTANYRIILTTAVNSYTSQTADSYDFLSDEQWLLVREILRKEQLMHRRFAGSAGYFMKAKRYGARCDCTNQYTGEINNSVCDKCFGTGILGGYHPAVPLTYGNMGNLASRERVAYNEDLGTVKDTRIATRMMAIYPIVQRDAWFSIHADDRFYVHNVRELAAIRDVTIVYDVELRLAPRSDILYKVPVNRPPDDPSYWQVEEQINI